MIGLADISEATIEKSTVYSDSEDELSFYEEPETHNDRGVAYHLDGQIDLAIAEYDKALRVNPDFTYAHCNLGIAYYALGYIDRAVQEFIATIKVDPELAEVHYNLGVAYKSKGEFDAAMRELLWALHADPDDADCHFNLGEVYETIGRIDEAIEHYRTYIQLAPIKDYLYIKHAKKKIRHLVTSAFLKKQGIQVYQLAIYETSDTKTSVTATCAA